MSAILAIDPGTDQSGWARLGWDGQPEGFGITSNLELLDIAEGMSGKVEGVAIEMIASYGMPVGREVFETCVYIGRLIEVIGDIHCRKVYRRQVKSHLCHSAKAKDGNIRQAILDRYPRTGGGKTPQIGTKAQPGPLYGVKSHVWAAIGVGLTAQKQWETLERF